MNLARLFMLGNLSAEIILPDDLPDWLKKIPKGERKAAWAEYQRQLKAQEWKEYKQKESEIYLPGKLPEWLERLSEDQRVAAWKKHQSQLKAKEWEEVKRQAKEWAEQKRKSAEWLERNPQAGPRSVQTGVDEEVQTALKVYGVLDKIRNAWASYHYPEAVKEHIKDTLNEFTAQSIRTEYLLEQAETQSAEADSIEKAEAALQTLELAKDFLGRANSIHQVFGPLFDKETVENQKYIINNLLEKLKGVSPFAHSQKLKQSFRTIAPMQEIIRTASRRIIGGEVDPSAFHFLKSAADRISRIANSVLTNPNASIQEQSKARETINLAESLKLLINTAMTEFIKEVKPATPQLSLPELFQQRIDTWVLSTSVDAFNKTHSQPTNPDERLESMKLFVDSVDRVLSSKRIDPSILPIIEKDLKKSFPAMRSVASLQLALPLLRDKDNRRIWRDENEKLRVEALTAYEALKTFVQMAKEGRIPTRSL